MTDLERCTDSSANVLGEVREQVLSLLDSDRMVCLISRTPRIAFRSVPGSSVLEDAALVTLPPLNDGEVPQPTTGRRPAGWPLPAVAFGDPLSVGLLSEALAELGQGLVAALDHAIFEVNPKGTDGLRYLNSREVEGLRGAGLLQLDSDGSPRLTMPSSLKLLKEALSEHVSKTVTPVDRLPDVVSGLWLIERTLRAGVRAAAIAEYGDAWRTSSIGGMKDEILRRAQLDTSVAAKSVNDLRDPLEWLTLGELLDIIRSDKFDQLGVEAAIWRKLQEQLVPIRNRLAHVRMLKASDPEIVQMWSSTIVSRLNA
ncbi:hypothetical protein ACFVAJ_04315 [Agromyces sp. NPDC057679]|uniref:hypothetical protein n=1 Tax=Agromyces sp. NPDC057679 TaxID=3346207 RepID=UPI00366C45C6